MSLRYRAGPRALERLRRDGLGPGSVRAVVGPASGPRWLALAGLDRALLSTDLLAPPRAENTADSAARILLAGTSAGGWRMLSFACSDPLRAHQRLLDGYIGQVFDKGETPAKVSRAYLDLLETVIGADTEHILDHPVFDLAIHTSRARSGGSRPMLLASISATAVLNLATRRATDLFFERVLFHSKARDFGPAFDGRLIPLTRDNLLEAVRATGTVPLYLEAVRDIPGAPVGAYVDGGLNDYHLRQTYIEPGEGLVLMPHYQQALLPCWLDRYRDSRRPEPEATADLLQIYPSRSFVASLPGGRLPDRDDFKHFVDDPEERIRRWRAVVSASEALGEQLLSDLESGGLADLVKPL